MKTTGLRALVVLVSIVAVFCFVGAASYTTAQLEAIASNELVPEISAAAGVALASAYATTMTEAQLESLAANGRTIGLRIAAGDALSILYRDKTKDELMAILTGTANPMIRAAAINPTLEYLVTTTSDQKDFNLSDYLKGLATTGKTHEMRLAAARAYYFVNRGSLKAPDLEAQAVKNDSAELAYAAGETLAGFYLSFDPKTQAQLEDLAINGQSEGMRVAGGDALASLLIKSDKTAQDFETTLLSLVGTTTAAYRNAYAQALSERFGS